MHMNYFQIVSPVPLCLEKWGVMTPSSYGSAASAYDCAQTWKKGSPLQFQGQTVKGQGHQDH